MTSENFCYWLQGYSEVTNGQLPNTTQWQVIVDHLNVTLKAPPYNGLSGSFTNSYITANGLTGSSYCRVVPQGAMITFC